MAHRLFLSALLCARGAHAGMFTLEGTIDHSGSVMPFKAMGLLTDETKRASIVATECTQVTGCHPGIMVEGVVQATPPSPSPPSPSPTPSPSPDQAHTDAAYALPRPLLLTTAGASLAALVPGRSRRPPVVAVVAALVILASLTASFVVPGSVDGHWTSSACEQAGRNGQASCSASFTVDATGGSVSGDASFYGYSVTFAGNFTSSLPWVPSAFEGLYVNQDGDMLNISADTVNGSDIVDIVSHGWWEQYGGDWMPATPCFKSSGGQTFKLARVITVGGTKALTYTEGCEGSSGDTFYVGGCPGGQCPAHPPNAISHAVGLWAKAKWITAAVVSAAVLLVTV